MLGLGWHALFGRRFWQLPLYWAGGVIGFFLGMALSGWFGWAVYRLGAVPLVEGSAGAFVILGLLWVLTTPAQPARRRPVRRRVRGEGPPGGKG